MAGILLIIPVGLGFAVGSVVGSIFEHYQLYHASEKFFWVASTALAAQLVYVTYRTYGPPSRQRRQELDALIPLMTVGGNLALLAGFAWPFALHWLNVQVAHVDSMIKNALQQ